MPLNSLKPAFPKSVSSNDKICVCVIWSLIWLYHQLSILSFFPFFPWKLIYKFWSPLICFRQNDVQMLNKCLEDFYNISDQIHHWLVSVVHILYYVLFIRFFTAKEEMDILKKPNLVGCGLHLVLKQITESILFFFFERCRTSRKVFLDAEFLKRGLAHISPFHATGLFLHYLKTSENL